MRVLGFDPGTIRMGYGVVKLGPRPEADDYGVIVLPKTMPMEQRLYQMYTHVLNMISIFQPDAIAVEEPFVGKGDRRFAGSALAVGQAQAVVLIGAAAHAPRFLLAHLFESELALCLAPGEGSIVPVSGRVATVSSSVRDSAQILLTSYFHGCAHAPHRTSPVDATSPL